MIKTVKPDNKEQWLRLRAGNINSTEMPALFGLSPYMTKFELWHKIKNKDVTSIEDNERMFWGRKLQDSIAEGLTDKLGLKDVRKMDEYIYDDQTRIGSSFDFAIGDDGILEIKNVDSLVFKNDWVENDDGSYDAPHHIEIQVQHQLAVSGRKYAIIGVLVGGNNLVTIKRERDEFIIREIGNRAQEFFSSIDNGVEPAPDFERDAAYIKTLYHHAEPGSVLDATGDPELMALAIRYRELSDSEKVIKTEKDAVKAQMILMCGSAEKVFGNGFSISAGVVGPAQVSYVREGYRNFRIFWRKKK